MNVLFISSCKYLAVAYQSAESRPGTLLTQKQVSTPDIEYFSKRRCL